MLIYPFIIPVAVQCEPLTPIPENGRITYAPDSTPDYDTGTVAAYQCNPGFSLEGNATRICLPLRNNAIWDKENETHVCAIISGSQEPIVIGAALGAVVLLLLIAIVIVIVVIVIVVIRRRAKHAEEPENYIVGDHIYEDPNLILFSKPSLPSRNIPVGENHAYERTFDMTENSLYNHKATSMSGNVVETEIGKCESERYMNVDEVGKQITENNQADPAVSESESNSYVSVKMQEDDQDKKPSSTEI